MTPYANHSIVNAVETPDLYTQATGSVPQHHKVRAQQWTDSASTNIPMIVVIGVGGGGNNTVNFMVEHPVAGIEFVNVNTDSQGLNHSLAQKNIQLGHSGLGTNGRPELARFPERK